MTTRADSLPASRLPAAYFAFAHVSLAMALVILAVRPDVPGSVFLHPRMVAVVHLLTIGWISGSILGACYVVAPLALGFPLPVGRWDWAGFGSFAAGTVAMVLGFWIGRYGGAATGSLFVLAAIVRVGTRVWLGARRSTAPPAVVLHVRLAFVNVIAAATFGACIAIERAIGVSTLPPIAAAVAHAHLAAIGWPVMMVFGLAYRLVPMFLPSRMPTGRRLATSAVLLELGLLVLVTTLLTAPRWSPLGAALVVAGFVAFAVTMRGAVRHRLPRPPALPRRDWSTWQTHAALCWLLVAAVLGAILTVIPAGPGQRGVAWIYGTVGLLGFVAQIVVGIQGRLVPLYAYYRAMAARDGRPPERAANALPSPAFARPIFLAWTVGVPWLACGLATGHRLSISAASIVLLVGVLTGAAYQRYLMREAHR